MERKELVAIVAAILATRPHESEAGRDEKQIEAAVKLADTLVSKAGIRGA